MHFLTIYYYRLNNKMGNSETGTALLTWCLDLRQGRRLVADLLQIVFFLSTAGLWPGVSWVDLDQPTAKQRQTKK